MLPKKRKKMILGFVFIYAIYIGILVYFAMFTVGLNVSGGVNEETGALDIIVRNESVHLIRNIDISWIDMQGEEQKIGNIAELSPSEEEKIVFEIPEGMDEVKIVAVAPYHQKVVRTIGASYTLPVELTYRITGQGVAFIGIGFETTLEVCNEGNQETAVSVVEEHDFEIFEEQNHEEIIVLGADSCEGITVSLTPRKTGTTKIYFNINAQNTSKQAYAKVEVME